MNMVEVARYEKMIAGLSARDLAIWIKELKLRASGLNTRRYKDISQLKLATEEEFPEIGLLGTSEGYSVSLDIENAYSFQKEYAMIVNAYLSNLGYSEKLKTAESIDPSALSGLMIMAFEKRKALEDRTMQLLGNVNNVLRSIITITHELKELDRNLAFFDLAKSKELEKRSAAELAIKRIFVDTVDARKGPASMVSLAGSYGQGKGGAGYVDLVSVFYQLKSLKDADAMPRNEQYKSIIKNRYLEYEQWKKISEEDLRNRREMLLQHLRSQFASYKMYADWAAESLIILKRINMAGIKNARDYTKAAKKPDIFETANFAAEMIGAKQVYRGNYEVEYQKVFGKRGLALPASVSLKSPAGAMLTQGPRENSRAFIHKQTKRLGPKVVAALEVQFAFTEKQFFPKESPQERPQDVGRPNYVGSLNVKLKPYCFTLDEWYLFKKANEAYINKTVFEGVDQVSVSSLTVIKKDLDHYIKEAEKRDKQEEKKKESNYALVDIYQSFKDDLFGINKALSFESRGTRTEFNPEYYEIEVNHRLFRGGRMKDAIALGLVVSGNDAADIYEGFKKVKGLLNTVNSSHNPLF